MKFEKCSNHYVSSAGQKEKSESLTGIEPRHSQRLDGRYGLVFGWSWVEQISGVNFTSVLVWENCLIANSKNYRYSPKKILY